MPFYQPTETNSNVKTYFARVGIGGSLAAGKQNGPPPLPPVFDLLEILDIKHLWDYVRWRSLVVSCPEALNLKGQSDE
jgi:hypothetical protein